MSKTNLHRTRSLYSLSSTYLDKELGPWEKCPKSSCKGYMISVMARYYDRGPINYELECILCNKILKDPMFRDKNYNKKNVIKPYYKNNKRRGFNVIKVR